MTGRDADILVRHSDGTYVLKERPVAVNAICSKMGCRWAARGRGAERAARDHARETGHTVVVRRVEMRIVTPSSPLRNDR